MNVERFSPEHLQRIELQAAQAWMRPIVDSQSYVDRMQAADSYTVIHDGEVIAVCAVVEVWPGRAALTSLLSARAGRCMLKLHREVSRRISALPHKRIEATVDDDFEPGHAWLRILGFRLETPHGMLGYLPDGRTGYLYARVK